MMRCPSGHESSMPDYCDTCGAPMDGPAPTPASAPAPEPVSAPQPSPEPAPEAGGATQTCPHCQAVNAEANLFCEVCGFDFTTGVMPRVEGGEPSFLTPVVPPSTGEPDELTVVPAKAAADDSTSGDEAPLSRSSALDLDMPLPATGDGGSEVPSPDGATAGESELAGPDAAETVDPAESEPLALPDEPAAADRAPEATPEPEADPAADADVSAVDTDAADDPVRSAPKPLNRPPSREVAGDWVVEVWIDPDWYAVQETGEPCPSVAPPDVVRLRGSDALIGRRSRSSVPDIDCGVDSAVSRRQALLASDGRRWWIEDLDSSNGTWVGPAIGPLPSAPISARTEIDADDRIYVGAWTRLVVRPAIESELTGD